MKKPTAVLFSSSFIPESGLRFEDWCIPAALGVFGALELLY